MSPPTEAACSTHASTDAATANGGNKKARCARDGPLRATGLLKHFSVKRCLISRQPVPTRSASSPACFEPAGQRLREATSTTPSCTGCRESARLRSRSEAFSTPKDSAPRTGSEGGTPERTEESTPAHAI